MQAENIRSLAELWNSLSHEVLSL